MVNDDARDDDRDREEFERQRAATGEAVAAYRDSRARTIGGVIGQLPVEAAVPAALLSLFMARMTSSRGKPLSSEFEDWKAARGIMPGSEDVPERVDAFMGATTLDDGRNARDALHAEVAAQQPAACPAGLPGLSVSDEVSARVRDQLGHGQAVGRATGDAPRPAPSRSGSELG